MNTTTFHTTRFGDIQFEEIDVVTFREGMLGFEECTRFLVLQHKEGSPFRWLQSIDDPHLAFLVVDPNQYCADYAPEMSDAHAKDLELTEETPQLVYTIVSIPKGQPEAMTLNLAGPIVINLLTQQAKQIVLDDPRYSIRFKPQIAVQPTTQPSEETAAA